MNNFRYAMARLGLAFGLSWKNKRLAEAAEETRLLRMAEEILGEEIWENTENLEAVSVEYWSLRKLTLKKKEIEEQVRQAGDALNLSHEERDEVLHRSNEAREALEKKRKDLIEKSDLVVEERNQIITRVRELRRQFDASRAKIHVLTQEGSAADVVREERVKMVNYKAQFESLKLERDAVDERIAEFDELVARVEDAIAEDRNRLKARASEAYQSIGKANQDVSQLSAEIGLIEQEMQEHFTEIGYYVSRHVKSDSMCRQLCKHYSGLVAQMHSLRNSIVMNHKLASMAGN